MEIQLELKEAALTGNTQLFLKIYRSNPLLLDQFIVSSSTETPLHVVALRGHVILAEKIIQLCPDLAESLDTSRSSPLHLATAKGCLDIVKLLVKTRPKMCTSLNRSGLSPVHLAVIKGRVEVVKELVQGRRDATQTKTDQGESVLHLCVKHGQFEVLNMLMESVDEVEELISGEDDYGNTILHLAVADKHTKIVNYLLTNEKVNINAKDTNGYTPLDILSQSRRDVQDWEIGNALQAAGAVKAAHITKSSKDENNTQIPSSMRHQVKSQHESLSRKRDALMVVASLLAAMAFQAGVNPPGGVWQEDSHGGLRHRAGEAVVAYNYEDTYKFYLRANTISFGASLSTILFLISGLPFKQRTFMLILTGIMWLSITSMAFTYGFSVVAVTPKKDRKSLRHTMYVAIPLWCGVMVLLSLGHTLNIIKKWLRKKGIDMWDHMKIWCNSSKGMKANEVPNV